MTPQLEITDLGRVPYAEALEIQEKRVEARRTGVAPDALLLLEHPAVVTCGRSSRPENLLLSDADLAARGVERFEIARGGDVTWHGPGQLVGYLVLDLAARGEADVHVFLRSIEAVLVQALAELGVPGRTIEGYTGVFVDDPDPLRPEAPRPRKIASIGVGLRGWVTWHGFALNVDPDLDGFGSIVPCGLRDVEMTSVARELGPGAPSDLDRLAREAVAGSAGRRWA